MFLYYLSINIVCSFVSSSNPSLIFQVHKTILAATSDYFRAMLQGEMRESQEERVDLKGLTAGALDSVITFMYTGSINLNSDNLTEVLNAASHLQVQAALDLCSDYISSLLTFSTAEELLTIADTYTLTRVNEFYETTVVANFEAFSQTDQFLCLSASQLNRYLLSNELQIRTEHLLYKLVARWYSHEDARKSHLEHLLSSIRFPLMSETQLNEIQTHWLTACHLNARGNISEGLKYHERCQRGHPDLTKNCKSRTVKMSMTMVHHGSASSPFEITAFDHHEDCFYQLITDMSGSRDCRITILDDFIFICRVVDCGGGTLLNSLLRFDPRHQRLQELTPCCRIHIDAAFVACGQNLFMFGGFNEHYAILDTVESYDVLTNQWHTLLPLPRPTHSLSACVYTNKIYLSGGVAGQDQDLSAALVCFTPDNQHWDSSLSRMHFARRLHQMLTLGNKLFVVGGLGVTSYHQQPQINMESYDISTNQWTILTQTLAGRSVGHVVQYELNGIMSIGREHYNATECDIWTYDGANDIWNFFRKCPYRSGLGHTSCTMAPVNFADEKVSQKRIKEKH